MPATEFAGRSIVEWVVAIRVERPKSEPEDAAPKVPPTMPAMIAMTVAERKVIVRIRDVGALHHGP